MTKKQPIALVGTTRYTPGSVPERCRECGDTVWIGPENRKRVQEAGGVFVCSGCLTPQGTGQYSEYGGVMYRGDTIARPTKQDIDRIVAGIKKRFAN